MLPFINSSSFTILENDSPLKSNKIQKKKKKNDANVHDQPDAFHWKIFVMRLDYPTSVRKLHGNNIRLDYV